MVAWDELTCSDAAGLVQVLCDFSIFDGDTGMWIESVPTPFFLCCHSSVALPIASQAVPPPSPSPLGKPLCCCHARQDRLRPLLMQ